MEKIEKHKLDEMGALNMKQKKWNKLEKRKQSSYQDDYQDLILISMCFSCKYILHGCQRSRLYI